MNDTDPMLGDEATQNAYKARIEQFMRDTVEEVRAARRQANISPETNPVLIGAAGFDKNLSSST